MTGITKEYVRFLGRKLGKELYYKNEVSKKAPPCGNAHRRMGVRGARRVARPALPALGSTACKNSPPDCFYFVN